MSDQEVQVVRPEVGIAPTPVPTEPIPEVGIAVDAEAPLIDMTPVRDAPAPVVHQERVPEPAPEAKEVEEDKEDKVVQDTIFPGMPALKIESEHHNVSLVSKTTSPEPSSMPDSIALPSAPRGTQEQLINSFPNLKDVKDPQAYAWAATVMQSRAMSPVNGVLEKALARPNSNWRQGVTQNGETFRSVVPRYQAQRNKDLTGEQGLQYAYSHMGLGDMFHAAMWNSGFWVTFTPAPETVWMNINRQLGMDVMGITRETYGLLHSSATTLATSTIINAILPYVYGTSVNGTQMTVRDIPKYLSTADEHDFIWGFIAANYPHGLNIDRSCIVNPNECRHVVSEKVHVTEMQVCDSSLLPEANVAHMRQRSMGCMTLESVIEYQKRMDAHNSSVITLTGTNGHSAKFHLQIPSSDKKTRMSDAYISETRDNILAVVTEDTTPDARRDLYESLATASELRLYQHWVKRIDLDDDNNNSIGDEKTIASTMGAWTRDPNLREQFFTAMDKYIANSTVSVIGLEPLVCPNCGKSHARPEQALRGKVDYVPIDVVQVFSALADYKTRLVLARI